MNLVSDDRVDKASLHDALSIGDFGTGVLLEKKTPSSDEARRLPMLLRVLSSSRPLSAVPTFCNTQRSSETVNDSDIDDLLETAVSRLEDRAALYSSAEDVEVVSCHLAPSICRHISRLGPVSSSMEELGLLASTSVGKEHRQRYKSDEDGRDVKNANEDDELAGDLDRQVDEDDRDDKPGSTKRRRLDRGLDPASAEVVEDSQEATVTRTLSELVKLVVRHLKSKDQVSSGEHGLPLPVDDSILSEARNEKHSSMGGDLGSALASLLYYSPGIKYEHVAGALCRAAVPQSAEIILCMAANCPSVAPLLLRGCLDVYRQEATSQHVAIRNTIRSAIRNLASLSSRDSAKVLATLRFQRAMPDMQLELLLKFDRLRASLFLLENLSLLPTLRNADLTGHSARTHISHDGSSLETKQSLICTLREDLELSSRTLTVLCEEIAKVPESLHRSGQTLIVLSAYSLFLARTEIWTLGTASQNGGMAFPGCKDLLDCVAFVSHAKIPSSHSGANNVLDRIFAMEVCAILLTFCHVAGRSESTHDEKLNIGKCLLALLNEALSSSKARRYAPRVVINLKFPNALELQQVIEDMLFSGKTSVPRTFFGSNFLDCVHVACEWASANLELDSLVDTALAPKMESSLLAISCMRNEGVPLEFQLRQARSALTAVLSETREEYVVARDCSASSLIQYASMLLLSNERSKIPLVFQLSLERLASRVDFVKAMESLGATEAAFLSQVLYSLIFSEREPAAAFQFDHRALPLKELYILCETTATDMSCRSVRLQLLDMLDVRYSEIRHQTVAWIVQAGSKRFVELDRDIPTQSSSALARALRAYIIQPSSDPSGHQIQKAFALARRRYCDAELFPLVASALLTRPKSPTVTISYTSLSRDPLLLLKCTARLWDRTGIRRVVLSMLATLFETHAAIVRQTAPTGDVVNEILIARNIILIRSLIGAITSGRPLNVNLDQRSTEYCSMTIALIRRLICERPDLLALMLKQGLEERSLDWIVTYIPECMERCSSMLSLVSDRSSFSAVERILVADSVLRIAMAHGHRYPDESKAIVYAALSQLIGSFFLVLGPVGVPVSTLVVQGTSLDSTHIARRVTFRMLNALSRVRSYRIGVYGECMMALQKLAGLCRGETIVGGLSGSVGNRQKNLLKDILDAVVATGNSLGVSLQV